MSLIFLSNMKNKGKNTSLSIANGRISNKCSNSAAKNCFGHEKKKYIINIKSKKKYLINIKTKKKLKRKLNSLEELTKKFVECVYEENTNIINLKNVIEKIKVKKRRIYDITNVMEGN